MTGPKTRITESFGDGGLSREIALGQNPKRICPPEILERQELLAVHYISFDGLRHKGQIVVDRRLARDVTELFGLMLQSNFPLATVIPLADPRFRWDDNRSMAANNSSGFNYRHIAGTDRVSLHGHGQAIDLNPALNPYIARNGSIYPPGARYDPARPGTVVAGGCIVRFLDERGWTWGGRWTDRKDYQHFEKRLE